MLYRISTGALALAATLIVTIGGAQTADQAKYPNWKGQWSAVSPPLGDPQSMKFDPTKRAGLWQDAPLTPEYQKIFEASLADQAEGGPGLWGGARCLPVGMPAMMTLFRPMEIIILPETTYIRIDHVRDSKRRIFTDDRDWPKNPVPGFDGYSIGKWLDTDGDGRFDTLEVETRDFKGPRNYEDSGMPLHLDNQSIVKERLSLDKTNPDILKNEITVIDHALTRPWTVVKNYHRIRNGRMFEDLCNESNNHVQIGKENYFMSADGYLMPAKKGQAPPDLRYFGQAK